MVTVREAGDVADVAQQLGGQHRPTPYTWVRVVLCCRTALRMAWAGRLDLAVEATHVGEQLVGDPLALDVDRRDRADPVPRAAA